MFLFSWVLCCSESPSKTGVVLVVFPALNPVTAATGKAGARNGAEARHRLIRSESIEGRGFVDQYPVPGIWPKWLGFKSRAETPRPIVRVLVRPQLL